MTENRRESNFYLRSDIDVRNVTANESGLSHLKCFRTPSVVVSDHSEETGCFAYDDIKRIHMAHGRKRKTKAGRRHSVDANLSYGHRKRSEPMDGNLLESYKSSLNVSQPVLRRKNEHFGVERKSVSLDDDLGRFESNVEFGKKVLDESDSSNELSVIPSECGSTNFGEGSGRNSIFSEISPVFLRKNMNFSEVQRKLADFEANTKIEGTELDLGCCVEPQASDDADFYFLERQRSLSHDDLYIDSSAASDVSYTDLSTDFSACSSLSNLAGTLYHKSYDSGREYSSAKCHRSNRLRNGNIKTSKSCSDFLSVSRIVEDYPHVKCRRHSNDQVAVDVSQCHTKRNDSGDESQKRWMIRRGLKTCGKSCKMISADDRLGVRMKLALGRLVTLKLKSFHDSLNFKKENYPPPSRKSVSFESFFNKSSRSIGRSRSSKKEPEGLTKKLKKLEKNDTKAKISNLDNCKKVEEVKKNWLSVEWKNDEVDAVKDEVSRKVSDCSTCSTNSEEQNGVTELFDEINGKTKASSWRKLRNIVQWTPFFQTYKKQRYPWVQLAGHQGNFKAGPEQGTILKKLCPKEEKCYKVLMKDALRPYVPEYKGQVTCDESDCIYLQLQDLLVDFDSPCVLDCKLGVRTYLEEELQKAKEKPKLRKDMYEKMIQIDPTAPTLEEHRLKAVTKPRYMIWRETISSTSTLGFRLEGVRKSDGKSSKDFKTTKAKEEVKEAFREFVEGFPHAVPKYIQRLKAIKATLEVSIFFSSHEIIGSSLLFVHDRVKANIWLIDFAKTLMLPEQTFIDHKSQWEMGNHEDGYLIGMGNLIEIFSELETEQKFSETETETETATSEPSAAIN